MPNPEAGPLARLATDSQTTFAWLDETCPECGGEMQDHEDRYEYGDGRWLVCEDCGYDVKL